MKILVMLRRAKEHKKEYQLVKMVWIESLKISSLSFAIYVPDILKMFIKNKIIYK